MAHPPNHTGPLTLVNDEDEHHDATEHSKLVMEAMRHLADQQVERAERLRAGARQVFVYVSGLFTVAQVAAFTGFAQAAVDDGERSTLIYAAMFATVCLAATGVLALVTDSLRRIPDMGPEDILTEADKAVDEGDFVGDKFTKLYLDAAKSRQQAVTDRGAWVRATTVVGAVTVIVTVAEVAISLYVRLP